MTGRLRGYGPFLLLCLIGFASFFCSYLRIPVLPLFAASLGAGPAQVGLINGAFMLTAGLLSIPGGLLSDRTGRKLPICAGMVAVAASSLLVTLCQHPGGMAAADLHAFLPALERRAPALHSHTITPKAASGSSTLAPRKSRPRRGRLLPRNASKGSSRIEFLYACRRA